MKNVDFERFIENIKSDPHRVYAWQDLTTLTAKQWEVLINTAASLVSSRLELSSDNLGKLSSKKWANLCKVITGLASKELVIFSKTLYKLNKKRCELLRDACLEIGITSLYFEDHNLNKFTINQWKKFCALITIPSLSTLGIKFTGKKELSINKVKILFDAINKSKATLLNLEYANLAGSGFRKSWGVICKHFNSLQMTSMRFSTRYFSTTPDENWKQLVVSFNTTNLRSLSLDGCSLGKISSRKLEFLVGFIKISNLSTLDLSRNMLGEWGVGLWQIFLKVFVSSRLQELKMTENYLFRLTVESWFELIAGMQKSLLKVLELGINSLRDIDQKILCKFAELFNQKQWMRVDLSANNFSLLASEKIIEFCNLLKNCKITELMLDHNWTNSRLFFDSGGRSYERFCESLGLSQQIRKLSFVENKFPFKNNFFFRGFLQGVRKSGLFQIQMGTYEKHISITRRFQLDIACEKNRADYGFFKVLNQTRKEGKLLDIKINAGDYNI